MPQYYFDVNGQGVSEDETGEMLPDDDAAWHEATLVAGEIFKDVDGQFKPGQQWRLEVLNEEQQPIYSINVTGRDLK
jgi:hypothetical protein